MPEPKKIVPKRNRRSNFDFYMQLCGKKEDLLNEYSNDKKAILRNVNKEIARLADKLGLEGESSDGESCD